MRLGYVILYVPDVAAAVAFYEAAFGLAKRFADAQGQYAELETGATALAFAQEDFIAGEVSFRRFHREELPGAVEIALVVDGVEASYRRALAQGATPAAEPARKPWGQTVAHVRDCHGFLVELCTEVTGE